MQSPLAKYLIVSVLPHGSTFSIQQNSIPYSYQPRSRIHSDCVLPGRICTKAPNAPKCLFFHWFYKVFRRIMPWIREPRGGSSPRPGFPGGSQGKPLFYQGFSMGARRFCFGQRGRPNPLAGDMGLHQSWKCCFSIGFIRFSR